jgi:hypothetical protein
MATFINKLMLMESQDFPLIKPKFTPNGRPLDRKKRNKRSVSLPDKLPSSVPLCMLQKPKSVTYKSLRECRESRPPLKSDLAGPNPASYTPRGLESNVSCVISPKPLNHRKEGRTLASSNEIWTYRVAPIDQGPTPSTYMMDNVFGMHQPVRHEPPSFTMGRKGTSSLSVKKEKMLAPGPDQYSVSESDEFVFHKWPSYSIGCKRTPNKGPSPGPAQYSPNYNYTQAHGPQYSMSRHTKHVAGLKC